MNNHARIEMALKLSMSKDLGQRPKELTWLTLKDIDLSIGNVSITGAKHTIGRVGQLKAKSLEVLKIVIRKKNLTSNSHIYNGSSDNLANLVKLLLGHKHVEQTEHYISLFDKKS